MGSQRVGHSWVTELNWWGKSDPLTRFCCVLMRILSHLFIRYLLKACYVADAVQNAGWWEWMRRRSPALVRLTLCKRPRKKTVLGKDNVGWFQKVLQLYTREWWRRGRSWGSFCGSLSLGRPFWRARGWVCQGQPSEDFGRSSQSTEWARTWEQAAQGQGGCGGASYRQREGDEVTDTREAGPEGLIQRGTLTRLTPDCHLHAWCKNAFHLQEPEKLLLIDYCWNSWLVTLYSQ